MAPRLAVADDSKLAAEALFAEGRKLVLEQRYAEATPKFEASQRLDPGIGTLMNLGLCYEKTGMTASAWLRFREAATLARRRGERVHEEVAAERIAALEPKLCRLTIKEDLRAATGASRVGGGPLRFLPPRAALVISRDHEVVAHELFDIAVPVDPGEHIVEASKSGHEGWSQKVVTDDTHQPCAAVVTIPGLKEIPEPQSPPPEHGDRPNPGFGTQRTTSLIVGAAGAVSLAFATGFAVAAKSQYETARSGCAAGASGCTPEQWQDKDSAGSKADAATGLFIGGGIAAAAGLILWLTSPSPVARKRSVLVLPSAHVGERGTTLFVTGQFHF